MATLFTAVQTAVGSVVSAVIGCGKWMLGCKTYEEAYQNSIVPCASPLVFERRSSMCIDDDGDVAHEFYEEVTSSPGKPWMRRITENLIEQGWVRLRYPRLHVDFPAALYEG